MRLVPLDVLRALAVFLVMGRHLPIPDSLPTGTLRSIAETWQRGGWIGVDLFFVLSGFLVSGLLFREHQRHGDLRIGRFLVRRGLKIYPAFYVFIAIVFAIQLVRAGRLPETQQVVAELVFLQNYFGGVWGHTWSLAVEEHFYFALPFVLLLLLRSRSPDPWSRLPWIAAGVALVILGLRVLTSALLPYRHLTHFSPTHLRADGLLLGVAFAWAYHYRAPQVRDVLTRYRTPLALGGLALLAPAFVWSLETAPLIPTLGFLAFALGSLALLGAGLALPERWHGPLTPVARIGAYSYSIYLWHLPIQQWGLPALEQVTGPLPLGALVAVYVTASVGVGIGMARVVEVPALALRDRLFPSRAVGGPNPTG